jgi:RHS repeat-associated protein
MQKVFTQNSTTTTTNYLYDGSNAVADVDQNGNVLARYAETQNIDEPLAELRSGTTSYYESDGLGSVTSLTNGAGAIANTYTYDSFGNVTASTGSITNRFQYTAGEFDSESGLYYYRARYYDPNAGRFLIEDPASFVASMNFYAYVGNSPLDLNDPYGLAECVYSVSQHKLTCTSNVIPSVGPTQVVTVGPAGVHSGDPGECRDNPKCVNKWGSGPITPGRYRMNADTRPEHAGRNIYRLEPWPHRTGQGKLETLHLIRGGFELHIGSITHGCINVDWGSEGANTFNNALLPLLVSQDGNNWLTVTQ